MTKRARQLTAGVALLIAMVGTTRSAIANGENRAIVVHPTDRRPASRVRTSNPALAAMIRQATERSATFRSLVQTIETTDGIVYVEHGKCPHGARACLPLGVTVSGSNRLLHILVDTHRADDSLMGSIAHELRHVIEVLSNRTLTTGAAIYLFYDRIGGESPGRSFFETRAAVETGVAVRAELRKSR